MILNKKNIDNTKNPLFLGDGLSLQRYDKFRYEKIFKLFRQHVAQLWTPEEIDISKDREQFDSLEEHEKFIFTKNLLYQTVMDSVVARGANTFSKYVTNNELEAYISAWQFFETIHSYSYTYIIKNVYANPSELLDTALEDKEIMARAKSVSESYAMLEAIDDSTNESLLREKIYLSLIDVNILESIRFYVSFVCAFAFAENKKMIGNADIIALIKKDECVTGDTQLLTESGWKYAADIKNEKIAEYNSDGSIKFVDIINRSTTNVDKIYKWKSKNNHINFSVSKNHRVIYNQENGLKEQTAENFTQSGYKYIINAGLKSGKIDELTPFDRLMIAYQADGIKLRNVDTGRLNGGFFNLKFIIKKQRKINRLEEILEDLGFDYKTKINKRGKTVFYIKTPVTYNVSKYFIDWVDFSDKSYKWCQQFIEEASYWDGHVVKENNERITYGSVIESNSEIVQTAAVLSGYRTSFRCIPDDRSEVFSDYYRVQINKHINCTTAQKLIQEVENKNTTVYGFEVPSGMILIRHNGAICVTGNSIHYNATQYVINQLQNNKDEGFVDVAKSLQDKAIEMFVKAAEEEKAWASYLFKDGSILGLNEAILHQYIEWLTDNRMSQINLPPQFNVKNPIGGWLDKWINPSSVQAAAQEKELVNYRVSSVDNDISGMDFEEL